MQPDRRRTTSRPDRISRFAPFALALLTPRWRKVAGDLWSYRLRTFLVVITIAIGTFAIGAINESRVRMLRGLAEGYADAKPFSAALITTSEDAFGDDLVEAIRKIPGVAAAEGRAKANVRLNIGPGKWADLDLRAVPDWDDIQIGKMRLEQGTWPPADKEMLIERSALSDMLDFEINVGDELLIETLDQKRRSIKVVGVVHDLTAHPTFFSGDYHGYITEGTLDWLGESRSYTSLHFAVDREHFFNKEYITRVAWEVRHKVEKSDREIAGMFVPPQPGRSPVATFILDPLIYILSALGIMAVFLGGFLVTNTISALLTQQIRQIGILKAIGARNQQIASMYLVLVLAFGTLSLVLAVPLAHVVAEKFSSLLAHFLNFNVKDYGIIPEVLVIQVFVSLVVPTLAAIYPIVRGTTITVHQALCGDIGQVPYGKSMVDRAVHRIRGLPRPFLLSLRNTFRRKSRLILTLTTLTMGGAIFMSVMSVQSSVDRSLNLLFSTLIRFDIQMSFDIPYRVEQIEQEALQVEGVKYIEGSGLTRARRLRPDGTESDMITIQGLPVNTPLLEPEIVQGRWLLPNDENAIAISTSILSDEPDLSVGEEVVITIDGEETTWHIVGVFQGLGRNLLAYANYPYFVREIGEAGQARRMQVITTQHDPAFQEQVAQQLEEHFRSVGIRVSDTTTAASERETNQRRFGVVTLLLIIMALLIALVGGLGLMGTMSMNVLERTREIGVMRAIGASYGSVVHIMVMEGVLIGVISWLFGTLIAFPLSRFLSFQVGNLFTGAPLIYTFSTFGVLLWLLIVVVLSAIASFLPAWNAARRPVREVLMYDG